MKGEMSWGAGHWRQAVLLLFLWLPIEDQFRKMLENSLAVYFVKDAIVVYILIASHAGTPSGLSLRMFPRPLARILFWGLLLHMIGCFHPALAPRVVALLGLKVTFSYVVLFPVGYAFASDERKLRSLMRLVVATAVVVALLGIQQAFSESPFLLPERSDALEETQLWETRAGFRYVTSTFISPGRFVLFLLNAFAIAVAAFIWDGLTVGRRVVYALAILTVVVSLLTSGGRTGVVSLAVLAPAMSYLALRSDDAAAVFRGRVTAARRMFLLVAAAMLVVTALAVLVPQIAAMLRFYWDSLEYDGPPVRLGYVVEDLQQRVGLGEWLVGHGTGSASVGTQYVSETLGMVVEGGYAITIWELGGLGLAFYVLLAIELCRVVLPLRQRSVSAPLSALLAAYGPLVLWQLWAINLLAPVLQQYVVAIFLWFFAGVAAGLAERAPSPGRPA